MEDLSSAWAAGVDLGGTKVEVAHVDAAGHVLQRLRSATDVRDGPSAVRAEIIAATRQLLEGAKSTPVGMGVGVAGQIEPRTGVVQFAPNLGWRNVALQADLTQALRLPVAVINDVRAATWGEWLHGAGRGCNDMVCLFVGTGIGGGVISGGTLLAGCSNSAGELGHMTIERNGPLCHCGNRGCLEALAGGWAIAARAQAAIAADPKAGATLLSMGHGVPGAVDARIVAQAALAGDQLARRLLDDAAAALIAGAVAIVNAFNPCCLVLGGGIIEGLPELRDRIDGGIRALALDAAKGPLRVLRAQLHGDAGVVGAAALAMQIQGDQANRSVE